VSEEALDLAREFFVYVANNDLDALVGLLDERVLWLGTRGGLDEEQVLRGPEAVRRYFEEIREPWERFEIEVERLMESGDAVVALMRESGRARHGGPEIKNETASVIRVRDGKIYEMRGYLDRDEALRAAGLA
jgi:ketosteroid isomerase-like protein